MIQVYLENNIDETIWIKVRARGQPYFCVTTDNEYWTLLNHAIGMGYQVNDNIVLFGYLNFDLIIANKLIEIMMLFNLVNIISKPTSITDHSSTMYFT